MNVGFLGFGFIGKVHAYGYLNLPLFYQPIPLEAKITHICTSRQETAEDGARLFGADHAVTDFRQITENPDIDIVHICTPNHLHKDALLSAMTHGKHIYCDKPLVSTKLEADEIDAALSSYTGVAQMTFNNRFVPPIMRAKQMIDEGLIGDVLEFRCCYLHSGSADPSAPLKWKLSAAAGGGVIADLASHVLDLIHHLVGDFDTLTATTKIAYPQRPSIDDSSKMVDVDVEDCVMLLAKMKNGSVGTIEATKISTGAEDEVRFEIHGSEGAVRFNGTDMNHLHYYNRSSPDTPVGGTRGWTAIDTGQRYPAPARAFPGPKFSMGWMRGHVACLANFLQSIAAGTPAVPGLDQGIYIQHLIDCCRASATSGQWCRPTGNAATRE